MKNLFRFTAVVAAVVFAPPAALHQLPWRLPDRSRKWGPPAIGFLACAAGWYNPPAGAKGPGHRKKQEAA